MHGSHSNNTTIAVAMDTPPAADASSHSRKSTNGMKKKLVQRKRSALSSQDSNTKNLMRKPSRQSRPRRGTPSLDPVGNSDVVSSREFRVLFLLIVAVLIFDVIYFTRNGPQLRSGLVHLKDQFQAEGTVEGKLLEEAAMEVRGAASLREAQAVSVEGDKGVDTKKETGRDGAMPQAGYSHAGAVVVPEHKENGDKGPILDTLRAAGVTPTPEQVSQLPSWEQVTSLYGSKPVIVGLEHCESFRASVPREDVLIGFAGMFNTGTNVLHELLHANCQNLDRMKTHGSISKGIRFEVPWGKHSPITFRNRHKTAFDQSIHENQILSVIVVKDPYSWMGSMCRHKYSARWRSSDKHCPNLVLNDVDAASNIRGVVDAKTGQRHMPVSVKFPLEETHHDSLAHLWNDWYGGYDKEGSAVAAAGSSSTAKFPRLIVRFEDLVFHTEEVITTICQKCAGNSMINPGGKFKYISGSAKRVDMGHKNANTGLMEAMMKFGSDRHRYDGYTTDDVKYAKSALSKELMEKFGYAQPNV